MTPLRPTRRLRTRTSTTVVLETNPLRRVLYGVLFVVLLIALVMNVDASRDFAGTRLVGTVVFLLIMVFLLGVSLSAWRMVADREARSVAVQRVLLGLVLSRRRIDMDRLRSVMLRRAVLIKGSATPEHAAEALRRRGIRRREVASLELHTDEESVSLDSATDSSLLREVGMRLAEFLGVPFEDVET